MSAFVVSKRDIDAIVSIVIAEGLFEEMAKHRDTDAKPGSELACLTHDRLGQLLWAENVKSVSHRYGMPARYHDEHHQYLADIRGYAYTPCPLEPGAARKIVACYDYQSCEHPEWEGCAMQILIEGLLKILPEDEAYRDAPWGNIERLHP